MARRFDIKPLDATFGAVVSGVKLAALDDATWNDVNDAWLEYALLIFPGQHLSRAEQIAFAKRFGPLEFELAPISPSRRFGPRSATKLRDASLMWRLIRLSFESFP